jgi:hypothetical protein
MSEREFLSKLKELLERHPEEAEKFLVRDDRTAKGTSDESRGNKRCVRWGVIPDTGKRVCLEWVDE